MEITFEQTYLEYRIKFKATQAVSGCNITVCNILELSNHYKEMSYDSSKSWIYTYPSRRGIKR